MPTESQIRNAIKAEEAKLLRQEASVEATKGLLELLKQQIDKAPRTK